MITHPANMIMTIVPRAVSALAGFDRVQSFLLRPSLRTHRGVLPRDTPSKRLSEPSSTHSSTTNPAVRVDQLRIGHESPILENINVEVATGSFTIISGPTGSGKSTLLRAILGEVVPAYGSVSLATRQISYCAQKPWLPSGTVREVICGVTNAVGMLDEDVQKSWYQEVIRICCLTHDFDCFPDGDQTQVGSRGLNLSGGQRQRVVSSLP
jgi:ABC-type bacteriocin/lantibiotic exporter with double-glycine peptidase domain